MATKKAPSSKAAAKTSSAKNTSQLLDLIPAQETQANAAAPNTADSADTAVRISWFIEAGKKRKSGRERIL